MTETCLVLSARNLEGPNACFMAAITWLYPGPHANRPSDAEMPQRPAGGGASHIADPAS
jgi:hypothetical protein